MSRIVSKKTTRIDLGEGEWVDVKTGMSFADLKPVLGLFNVEGGEQQNVMAAAQALIKVAIVDWFIRDDEGEPVPYSAEKIDLYDLRTTLELGQILNGMYIPEKKSSIPSIET